jgi:tellurite resistance protein TehA-like permease
VSLRPPSFDHGFVSGIWAITFGLIILLGALGLGVQTATAFIIAALGAALIFVYVRLYGEDRPGPRA